MNDYKFKEIPKEAWPPHQEKLVKVFKSIDFLVQVYQEKDCLRLSINRTAVKKFINDKPLWKDKILWDEIQDIKKAIGYDHKWGVEYYPPSKHFINDANMRHIFLFDEKPAVAWTKND